MYAFPLHHALMHAGTITRHFSNTYVAKRLYCYVWIVIPFVLQGGEDTLWEHEELQPCIFGIPYIVGHLLEQKRQLLQNWSGFGWDVYRRVGWFSWHTSSKVGRL